MTQIPTRAIMSEAKFSEDRKQRFLLGRSFQQGQGTLNIIMLNPSTADGRYNDPTVNRCEVLATELGFKNLIVTNIFSFRATDPDNLLAASLDDLFIEENKETIVKYARQSNMVICAWGNHGKFHQRGKEIETLLRNNGVKLHALKLNKDGSPGHPLYLPKSAKPFIWRV